MTERDYGNEAHQAAERHLTACYDALEAEEFGAEDVTWPDLDAPFCGCMTCVTREILSAGWPALLEGAREQIAREVEKIRDEPDVSNDWTLTEVAALIRGGWAKAL